MAKYIRTKDGIISTMQTVRKADVVKYGDTIEELCDAFVIKEYDNITIHYVRYLLEDAKSIFDNEKDLYPDLKIELYGSIWVDGDLNKVAKMNEKGGLVLL